MVGFHWSRRMGSTYAIRIAPRPVRLDLVPPPGVARKSPQAVRKRAVFSRIHGLFGLHCRHWYDLAKFRPSLALRPPPWQGGALLLCIEGPRRAGDKPAE